jgi:predicted GNAT family acetyltransferase
MGGPAVACCGWRTAGPGTAEVKRLYVDPLARGQGLARRLLEALEQHARHSGKTRVILETGALSHAALALFTSCGFTSMESYVEGRNPDVNRALQKTLSPPVTGRPEQAARAPLAAPRRAARPASGGRGRYGGPRVPVRAHRTAYPASSVNPANRAAAPCTTAIDRDDVSL